MQGNTKNTQIYNLHGIAMIGVFSCLGNPPKLVCSTPNTRLFGLEFADPPMSISTTSGLGLRSFEVIPNAPSPKAPKKCLQNLTGRTSLYPGMKPERMKQGHEVLNPGVKVSSLTAGRCGSTTLGIPLNCLCSPASLCGKPPFQLKPCARLFALVAEVNLHS